jgi:hypothetical protein
MLRPLGLVLGLVACVPARSTSETVDVSEGFALSGTEGLSDSAEPEATIEPDPNYKIQNPFNHSSLPIAVKVGQKGHSFDATPKEALPPKSVFEVRRIGKCVYGVYSGLFEANRFYRAGERWVPAGSEIAANSVLRVELGESLSVSFSAPVYVRLAKARFPECVKLLRGKRRFLGRYTFANSGLELVGTPDSPIKKFEKAEEGGPLDLHVKWAAKDSYPVAEGAEGIPAEIHTPVYKVNFTQKGYYFLILRPKLEAVSPEVAGPKVRAGAG